MEYTIKIPNEFKSEYAGNKFEETFERLLADTKGKVDVSIYKKVNQMEHAFAESEINENGEIILSLPYEDKPEDILKAASSKLTTIYPYLCGRYERETIDMLNTAFKDASINIKEKTKEINMTGLERIREESKKNENLKQQEEELRNNNEGYGYKRTAFENIKKYFDTLNEILKDTDIGDFNIPLEDEIKYKHYKRNVRTLGETGYKSEYQNEFGYQRAIISFNKTYGKNDENNPNLFANNGLFSKIALNWDEIQKTIEEDITERLQNRNEELEAYKKLSNEGNTRKAAEYER
jgi:hypothetical protein